MLKRGPFAHGDVVSWRCGRGILRFTLLKIGKDLIRPGPRRAVRDRGGRSTLAWVAHSATGRCWRQDTGNLGLEVWCCVHRYSGPFQCQISFVGRTPVGGNVRDSRGDADEDSRLLQEYWRLASQYA